MSKAIALGLLGVAVMLVAILLRGVPVRQAPRQRPGLLPLPGATAAAGATPEPTPEPEPTELGIAGFLQQCEEAQGALAARFTVGAIDQNQTAQGDDVTWGNIAEIYAATVDSYSELEPPQEVQDYYDAWLATAEALVDHARTRPGQESFLEGLLEHSLTVFNASMEIELDPDKSEEEKQRLTEALNKEALGNFFGPGLLSATEAQDEALAKLSAETSALLEGSDCYFEVAGGPTESEVGDDHRGTPDNETSIEAGEVGDDHGDTPDNATSIEVGEIVEGRLEVHDADYFRFEAEQGHSDVVSLPGWSLSTTGSPLKDDAETITLYDSAARQLASANLSSSPHGITWVALISEYIYIAIGEDGSYGFYTLTVAPDDHGHDPSTATSMAIGESVEFTLYGNDTDYFRFQAEAGQDYRVDIEHLTSVWGMPHVAIHNSSGRELASFSSDEEIIVESPGSGDYYIASTMEPEGFGGFKLLVFSSKDAHGDSVESATFVEVGEPVRGVVYPEDDPDFFVFQAEGGKFYEIGVAGNLYDARIALFDSDEALLESFGAGAIWKTERAGEYYIGVTDYTSPSSYTLSVSVLEITDDHGGSAADASAITIGESIEGEVNYLGDEDVFLFQVEAGTIYEIDVAPGTLTDSDLVVYDEPDEWKRRFISPVLSVETHRNVWRPEYTGDSYLVVGFPGSESGSYTVEVAEITLAGNTSYDSDDDGLIEVANLEQLDAIRWDLDGDGLPDSSAGIAGFAAAFPDALDGMGCPDSGCSGYELISALDLDTNNNGWADAGDDYWNDGEGWAPIGGDFEAAFESSFNGDGHTISNLYIDRRDAEYVGLFGNAQWNGWNRFVGLNNNIRDLALVNVDVRGGVNTGALAGFNGLVIVGCSVTGAVSGGGSVGGLVGDNFSGEVIASYSAASVADGSRTGGLVDSNFADQGTAIDSYWNGQTSGQSGSAGGEGKTTSELHSPTGYTGIYENWNLDIDEDGVGDDLWNFGNVTQYPTLRHGS